MSDEHVVLTDGSPAIMKCLHCGNERTSLPKDAPCPLESMLDWMNVFAAAHQDCKPATSEAEGAAG